VTSGKPMKSLGSKIQDLVWDFLFPIKCINCSVEGVWVCQLCLDGLRVNTVFTCPVCRSLTETGLACRSCRNASSLDGLLVVFEDNVLIRKLVKTIKYYFITDLVSAIEPKLNNYISKSPLVEDFCVLVPVPLHKRRFLERGFNQSQLLCDSISDALDCDTRSDLLLRTVYHHRQVGLSSGQRMDNIAGSFRVNQSQVSNLDQTIVLVDDVYTTGATMCECVSELKKAGYKKVLGLVLVRG
jgi:competence protein ComFC